MSDERDLLELLRDIARIERQGHGARELRVSEAAFTEAFDAFRATYRRVYATACRSIMDFDEAHDEALREGLEVALDVALHRTLQRIAARVGVIDDKRQARLFPRSGNVVPLPRRDGAA